MLLPLNQSILTPRGSRMVAELHKGELVWGMDGEGAMTLTPWKCRLLKKRVSCQNFLRVMVQGTAYIYRVPEDSPHRVLGNHLELETTTSFGVAIYMLRRQRIATLHDPEVIARHLAVDDEPLWAGSSNLVFNYTPQPVEESLNAYKEDALALTKAFLLNYKAAVVEEPPKPQYERGGFDPVTQTRQDISVHIDGILNVKGHAMFEDMAVVETTIKSVVSGGLIFV